MRRGRLGWIIRYGAAEATAAFGADRRQRSATRRSWQPPGQSIVELAVILPVLLTLLLGITDFGRVFYYQIGLTDAAAQGVRLAARSDRSDAEVRTAVKESAPTLNLADGVITIARPLVAGLPATVAVNYTFTPLTPFVSAWLPGGSITLLGQASAITR